jgi:mannitol-specific phosphotransferase system IIBC component
MSGISGSDVKKVVVACEAGMGSSALLATQLAKQLRPFSVGVEHTPVHLIPADADVVLCHVGLADRARQTVPDKVVIGFKVFLGDPAFSRLVASVRDGAWIDG